MSLMFFCLKFSFSALMSLMFFLSKNLILSPYVPYVLSVATLCESGKAERLLSKNLIRSLMSLMSLFI